MGTSFLWDMLPCAATMHRPAGIPHTAAGIRPVCISISAGNMALLPPETGCPAQAGGLFCVLPGVRLAFRMGVWYSHLIMFACARKARAQDMERVDRHAEYRF